MEKLKDLQSLKPEDVTPITLSVEVLPYSTGCVHWDISPGTDIRAILAAPVRKIEKGPDLFHALLQALKIAVQGIMGSAHPKKNRIVEALVEGWVNSVSKREEARKLKLEVGDFKFYGDIWVLHLSLAEAGLMYPGPLNITQNVRVQITVGGQPIDGSVIFERVKALTNPPPPTEPFPTPQEVYVPAEGTTIALGKGWQWKLTAFAAGQSASVEIAVPYPKTSVTIEVPPPEPPPDGG